MNIGRLPPRAQRLHGAARVVPGGEQGHGQDGRWVLPTQSHAERARVRSTAAAGAATAPSLCTRSAAGCLHGRLSHSVHDFEYNHQILANLLDYSIEIGVFLLLQMVYNLQI